MEKKIIIVKGFGQVNERNYFHLQGSYFSVQSKAGDESIPTAQQVVEQVSEDTFRGAEMVFNKWWEDMGQTGYFFDLSVPCPDGFHQEIGRNPDRNIMANWEAIGRPSEGVHDLQDGSKLRVRIVHGTYKISIGNIETWYLPSTVTV